MFPLTYSESGDEVTMNKKISSRGPNWDEVEKELFTPEETAASNLRVAIIGELIKACEELGVSQKKLIFYMGTGTASTVVLIRTTGTNMVDALFSQTSSSAKRLTGRGTLSVISVNSTIFSPLDEPMGRGMYDFPSSPGSI